jgi:ribosome-associated toxin RatA of RatAB toxin-antitoxin module
VPWYEGTHEEDIAAPRPLVYETLTDYDHVPDWQGPVSSCDVVERHPDGQASLVRYEVSTPVKNVAYSLRHTHDPPNRVTGELVDGQIKGFSGEWRFAESGPDTTHVVFALRIDPGRWVPGKIARMLHETVMKRAVKDLKAEAERRHSG